MSSQTKALIGAPYDCRRIGWQQLQVDIESIGPYCWLDVFKTANNSERNFVLIQFEDSVLVRLRVPFQMEGGLPETLYRFNVIETWRLPSGSPIHSHVPAQHHNQIKSELQHPPLNYTNQPIYQPNVYQSNAYHNHTSHCYTNPAIPSIQPTVHIPLAYPYTLYRELPCENIHAAPISLEVNHEMRFDSVIDLKELDIRRQIDAAVALNESELQRRIESVVAVKESEVDARIKSAVALKESEVLNRIHSALALKESEVEDRIKSAVALNESELQRRIESVVAVKESEVDARIKSAVALKESEVLNRIHSALALKESEVEDRIKSAVALNESELQRRIESVVAVKESEVDARIKSAVALNESELQSRIDTAVIAALVDKDAVLRKQLELDNRSYKHNLDDNFNKDKESLQRAFKSEVTAKVQKKLDSELQYLQSKFKSSVESESIVKQGQISTIVENLFDDAMIQLSLLFSV